MAQSHGYTDTDTTVYRPESVVLLWSGVLLAPAAFLCGLIALYALSSPDCLRRHQLVIHAVHLTTIFTGFVGIAAAWSSNRNTRRGPGAAAIGLGVRFLARISIGSSTLFVLAMLLQWGISFAFVTCG